MVGSLVLDLCCRKFVARTPRLTKHSLKHKLCKVQIFVFVSILGAQIKQLAHCCRARKVFASGRPGKVVLDELFFPRARAKGSCCLRLPPGVWNELRRMPERTAPIEKSKEFLRFFNISAWRLQKPMVFQPSGSESFKNQRIFNGFRVRPWPWPGLRPGRG